MRETPADDRPPASAGARSPPRSNAGTKPDTSGIPSPPPERTAERGPLEATAAQAPGPGLDRTRRAVKQELSADRAHRRYSAFIDALVISMHRFGGNGQG
jgi:hypothetical protein